MVVVEEQLEDVLGPRLAAELGVGHLVAPVAEIGRLPVDADQEVRVADPALVHEAPLVDDLLPGAHRREGFVHSPLPRGPVCPLDRQHAAPLGTPPRDDLLLVPVARSRSSSMFGGFRLPTGSSRASSTSRYVRYSQPRNRLRAEGLLGAGVGEDGWTRGEVGAGGLDLTRASRSVDGPRALRQIRRRTAGRESTRNFVRVQPAAAGIWRAPERCSCSGGWQAGRERGSQPCKSATP